MIALRWTPRWWHWLLFAVVFVLLMIFAVLFALRATGRADYQRVIVDLQAKGTVATIDEFIVKAPAVDATVQEAWHVWSSTFPDYPDSSGHTFNKDDWIRYVLGQAPLPGSVLEEIEGRRKQMQVARDLLQDPRLLVSVYGWLAQDLPPGRRALPHTAAIRIPNLLSTRSLANWLHHAACTEADSKPALDDFDRFHRALSRPASLIDAMIWTAVANIRNDTYLHLALLGRLPATNRDAWLAEDCRLIGGVADGFEAERVLFNGGWTQLGEDTSFLGSFRALKIDQFEYGYGVAPSDAWKEWLSFQWLYSGPWAWATIHHDSAITVELQAHISARLRGETMTPVPDWSVTLSRYRGYGAIAMPNLLESGITALEAEAKHRMYRIAVTLLTDAPIRDLPADAADLATRLGTRDWLAPSGDRLHLTYERLGPERFRLLVSPTSPVPNFDAAGRLTGRTAAFGTPPDKRSLVTHPHLEILLPPTLHPSP